MINTKIKPFKPGPIICRDGTNFTVVKESIVIELRDRLYEGSYQLNPNADGLSAGYIHNLSYEAGRKVILEKLSDTCVFWLKAAGGVAKPNAVKVYGAIVESLTTQDKNEQINLTCNNE